MPPPSLPIPTNTNTVLLTLMHSPIAILIHRYEEMGHELPSRLVPDISAKILSHFRKAEEGVARHGKMKACL